MREFLDYVAKQLVDTPDAVQITEEEKKAIEAKAPAASDKK